MDLDYESIFTDLPPLFDDFEWERLSRSILDDIQKEREENGFGVASLIPKEHNQKLKIVQATGLGLQGQKEAQGSTLNPEEKFNQIQFSGQIFQSTDCPRENEVEVDGQIPQGLGQIVTGMALEDVLDHSPQALPVSQHSREVQSQALKEQLLEQTRGDDQEVLPPINQSTDIHLRLRPRRGRSLNQPNFIIQPAPQDLRDEIRNFVLPDGWYTEVRNRLGGHSSGHTDRYYIEASTGRVCRSRQEVINYLRFGRRRPPRGRN